MIEEWNDIPGWKGFYQASTWGQVRSLDRTTIARKSGGGPGYELRRQKGKVLAPGKLKNGYLTVSLVAPGRKRRYAYVHDLVAEAFFGPKPPGHEICHWNGVRDDNYVFNLRYDTRSANSMDRHRHGTVPKWKGEDVPSAKLTWEDAAWIRANARRLSQREMGRRLGVSHRTVGSVLNGISWRV